MAASLQVSSVIIRAFHVIQTMPMIVNLALKVSSRRSSCRRTESLVRRLVRLSAISGTLLIALCRKHAFHVIQVAKLVDKVATKMTEECVTLALLAIHISG